MNAKTALRKFLSGALCGFVFFTAACAFLPQVHAALHAHHDTCSEDSTADNQDLCSVQNHLAADLGSALQPVFQMEPTAQDAPKIYSNAPAGFIPQAASSRAPPLSPVK